MDSLMVIGSAYLAEVIAVLVLALSGGTNRPGKVIAELWGWTTIFIAALALVAKLIEWAL
ncbi:hypothetical protein [Dickeya fangzhongdai]|uniref:hypothetical protein n=1 Tax=Dickeya fangzhongdai TaxID=1778540 RepID=UPI002B2566E4|nr:hypothetical protein [Dickeya fangzhongdai]WOX99940.1 hypothetical protein OGM22_20440 [Dickeya fangzhongdai]WOY04911.1 hypothetical protein OGM21_01985 [Dickeya fangzhongdai]